MEHRELHLECGCVIGFCRCSEADRSWVASGDAYPVGIRDGGWGRYEDAMRAYREHLEWRGDGCDWAGGNAPECGE